jgi:hypothetical protein
MRIDRIVAATVSIALLAGTAVAQTPTPTTTTTTTAFTNAACTTSTVKTNLQTFSVERTLPLSAFNSTFTPTFPPNVLSGVQSNALEIREGINWSSPNSLLTLNLFTVQPGAALPTPTGGIPSGSLFSTMTIKVDAIYTSSGPRPGVMFVGTVATNTPVHPFGDLTGSPAAVSIGYTSDTPAKINNVGLVVSGMVMEVAGTAGGTVSFISSPVTPPGSGAGPAIVIAPVGLTTIRVVNLDASATTSPNMPLTFQWSVVAGAADVAGPTAANATGYILGGAGTYTFRVTVTDSKGNVSTKDIDVQFL